MLAGLLIGGKTKVKQIWSAVNDRFHRIDMEADKNV